MDLPAVGREGAVTSRGLCPAWALRAAVRTPHLQDAALTSELCWGHSGQNRTPLCARQAVLTSGISGTPDRSRLPRRRLLPDHGAEAVLITYLMGLCRGTRVDKGDRGSEERAAMPPPPGHQGPQLGWQRQISPGHRWVLHCRNSSCGPWQAAPPKKGPEHSRSRRWLPPPQVALQPPHVAQACHLPSTAGVWHTGQEGLRSRSRRLECSPQPRHSQGLTRPHTLPPAGTPDLGTAAGSSLASPPSGPGTRRRHTRARCIRACAAAGPGSSWRSRCSSWTTRSSFRPLPGPGEEEDRKPA